MKKIITSISLFLIIILTGCIKNTPATSTVAFVEFDAASWNANSVGLTYPLMTRVPLYGVSGGGATLTRTTGTFKIRVNLLGEQRSTPTSFNYQVVSGETTAIAGTHYTAFAGFTSIPANSSFGFIDIPILNSGISSATPVNLVLELINNNDTKANVNYAKIGFTISQL